jgi:hypothetical protein
MKNSVLSEALTEAIVIEPRQIVGTKWKSWCSKYRNSMSVEFVDNKNCIYISQPKEYPETYVVAGGKIFISNIEGAFELRGNILFNNDLPAFEKAA